MARPLGKKDAGAGGAARAIVFVAIGLLCACAVLIAWWWRPSFLASIDLKASDAMFQVRGARPAPSDVVIVAVDEKSVNELGRWPWDRATTAALVTALGGARTVALDIVFSEPSAPGSDIALSRAIGEAGNVVLGYFFRADTTAAADPGAARSLHGARMSVVSADGARDAAPWPLFPSVETNTTLVGAGSSGFGAFNSIPGPDGVYREINLVFGYDDGVYPALSVAAVARFFGVSGMVRVAGYGVDGLSIGGRAVPADEAGALTLNFYGHSGAFKTYSASDVIRGRVSADEFEGRLVFVGVTEKAVYDIRPTPLDALFPGVELHATAAANIMRGESMIRDARVIVLDILVTVLAPVILALLLSGVRRTIAGFGALAVLLVVVVTGEFALFSLWHIKTAVVYPVLSVTLAYMAGEAYRNIVVEKKSRYLKRAFSSYVSPELVAEIMEDPGRLRLGGERRVVSVLFSDIRGFTGISERFSPEELVEFLNRYLSPMTGIVLEEKGMVDKYIGDAIMAVFNAPVEVKGHAGRACTAALRMMEALEAFNSRSGYPAIEIGIGINTGEAVVGNMGAELKLNYTAIGDTVNLASRLEGMNKVYGTGAIVSVATREAAGMDFVFRELDPVRVVGREAPIAIFELAGTRGRHPEKERLIGRFHEALALYRGRRFEEASRIFEGLENEGDPASAVYAGRCARFMKDPPPEGWAGVFDASAK